MRYICLVYRDEERIEELPDDEYAALVREVLHHREELRESGHFIAASPLQPTKTAATIRVRGSRMAITDGPFAETKEQLGGFYLIEASDLNEAIRIASRIPSARLGCIEIRALKELETPCGSQTEEVVRLPPFGGTQP